MAEELLPPDPSRDAYYHVITEGDARVWFWVAKNKAWTDPEWGQFYPQDAINIACLASPHPIPTPEQLNALHALPDALRDRANKAVVSHSERRSVGNELFGRAGGIVSTFRECAAVIQEALGTKPAPNDPPGNGLDDIRAAAMDQWDVPRAGEETTP